MLNEPNEMVGLGEAVRTGNVGLVKAALTKDLKIAAVKDDSGRVLLHWAASGGQSELTELILIHFHDVDVQDDMGWTALMIACSAGHEALARLLICKGASVLTSNNNGQTCLHYAASKDHDKITKLLLDNGCDPNIQDKYGATALHRAASKENMKSLALILAVSKVNVNIPDKIGNTPLHMACEEDRQIAAIALVRNGAHLDRQNKAEQTAMDLASPGLRKSLGRIPKNG